MNIKIRLALGFPMVLALTGCMATAGGPLGDRQVTGHSEMFSSAQFIEHGDETEVVLGDKHLMISRQAIHWGSPQTTFTNPDHLGPMINYVPPQWLALPAGWHELELTEKGKEVLVRVDGWDLGRIDPKVAPTSIYCNSAVGVG